MKNYREFISVSIFLNDKLVASVHGDRIHFDTDGHAFLYLDNVIVSHFTKGTWNNAKLFDKWIDVRAGEVVNYFNYWIEL
jgi:hypothetical protein